MTATGGARAATPAGVTLFAAPGDGWVALSWPAGPEATLQVTRYEVYRNGVAVGGADPAPANGGAADTRFYWDRGLANGAALTYAVRAIGASTFNDSATVVTTPVAQPPAFGPLSALPGNGYIRLSWSATWEGGVSVYRLSRATHPGLLPDVPADEIAAVTYALDQGLANRTEYYYLLSPCCPARAPSYASAVPFRHLAGAGVPVIVPDPSGRALSYVVSWTPAGNDTACGGPGAPGAYPIAAYRVYRSDDQGTTMLPVGTVPAAGCGLSLVTGVPEYGRRYYFLVRPVDDRGNVGEAYPLAFVDVPLPETRLLLSRNLFRPGPERAETLAVDFQTIATGRVRIGVYTAGGQVVRRRLYEGEVADPATGPRSPFNTRDRLLRPAAWDGTNDDGEIVASGVYLIVLEMGKLRDIRMVAVVR